MSPGDALGVIWMSAVKQDGMPVGTLPTLALAGLEALHGAGMADLLVHGFEACNVAVALFGPDDTIAFMNESFRALMNVPTDARDFSDIIRHADRTATGPMLSMEVESWLAMAASKRRVHGVRSFEIDMRDGRWFMVNESCIEGGWLWNFYTDITTLKFNEHRLEVARDSARRDADTDPLTGIFNRRHGFVELERQLAFRREEDSRLSVMLIDLDNFKRINDEHGHLAGDAVLNHFADRVSWLVRRGDIFARYGGEEFMLIMPGAGASEARAAAERIRLDIRSSAEASLGHAYTFSAGIAECCPSDDVTSLLRRADNALYRAKNDGRDCSRVETAD